MNKLRLAALAALALGLAVPALAAAPAAPAKPAPARKSAASSDACVTCHQKSSPGVVADWKASRHAAMGVGCTECHGSAHLKKEDAKQAAMPTPETCGACHEAQVAGF